MKSKIVLSLFLILFGIDCGKTEKSPEFLSPSKPKVETYYILTKRSLVRKSPSLKAKIVSTIPKNKLITILKRKKDWILFEKRRKSYRGWVYKPQLLKFKTSNPYVHLDKSINFYASPNEKSKIVYISDTPVNNTNFTLFNHLIIKTGIKKNGWEKLITPLSQFAWVKVEDLYKKNNKSKNVFFVPYNKQLDLYVKCSSVLKEGKYLHEPKNLFDNDFTTAWQEADGLKTEGQWLEIIFPHSSQYDTKIYIVNGIVKKSKKFEKFGKDGDLYYLNNRIKSVRITYSVTDLCSGLGYYQRFLSKIVSLKDNMKKPQFLFALPSQLHSPNLKIEILSVYKGHKWDDSPISEIIIKRKRLN